MIGRHTTPGDNNASGKYLLSLFSIYLPSCFILRTRRNGSIKKNEVGVPVLKAWPLPVCVCLSLTWLFCIKIYMRKVISHISWSLVDAMRCGFSAISIFHFTRATSAAQPSSLQADDEQTNSRVHCTAALPHTHTHIRFVNKTNTKNGIYLIVHRGRDVHGVHRVLHFSSSLFITATQLYLFHLLCKQSVIQLVDVCLGARLPATALRTLRAVEKQMNAHCMHKSHTRPHGTSVITSYNVISSPKWQRDKGNGASIIMMMTLRIMMIIWLCVMRCAMCDMWRMPSICSFQLCCINAIANWKEFINNVSALICSQRDHKEELLFQILYWRSKCDTLEIKVKTQWKRDVSMLHRFQMSTNEIFHCDANTFVLLIDAHFCSV